MTFPTPGEDISLFPYFSGQVGFFFIKKIVLDWGDLCRGQGGGKRDEKGQKIFLTFFSPVLSVN